MDDKCLPFGVEWCRVCHGKGFIASQTLPEEFVSKGYVRECPACEGRCAVEWVDNLRSINIEEDVDAEMYWINDYFRRS